MENVLAVLLAGGAGERLFPLTRHTAKPAVSFGGIYRIIDFTLSNCINSDIRRIFILTQYKALELIRHLRNGWYFLPGELGEFVEVIPPMKRVHEDWYLGTADAVYQNLESITSERPAAGADPFRRSHLQDELSGDDRLARAAQRRCHHRDAADPARTKPTASASPRSTTITGSPALKRSRSTVIRAAAPSTRIWSAHRWASTSSSPRCCAASCSKMRKIPAQRMISAKMFYRRAIREYRVIAFDFRDLNDKTARYWRDVGTLDAYYEANLDLVAVTPEFNLYDERWPIRTRLEQAPPAKFVFAQEGRRMGVAIDSIVSPGCIVSGGRVIRSVSVSGRSREQLLRNRRCNYSCQHADWPLQPGSPGHY